MTEKYSVELEVITEKFNQKMAQSSKEAKNMANDIKKYSSIDIGQQVKNATKSDMGLVNDINAKAIHDVANKTLDINNTLNSLKIKKIDVSEAKQNIIEDLKGIEKAKIGYVNLENPYAKLYGNLSNENYKALKELEIDSDLINNNLVRINDEVKDLTSNLNNSANSASNLNNQISGIKPSKTVNDLKKDLFKDNIKSASKFMLSLFSIRTIWSLISRIGSTALGNNEKLTSKTQIISSVLSNTLLPVLQRVVNWAEYGVIILAKVIQFFTGWNALTNVTTSNLKQVEKQSKAVSRSLAGIDEITNINQSSGSLASGIQNDLNALNDFQSKIKEVEEAWKKFTETPIGGFISDIATKFKNLSPEMKIAAGLATVLGIKLGEKGLSKILTTLGTDLLGIKSKAKSLDDATSKVGDSIDKVAGKTTSFWGGLDTLGGKLTLAAECAAIFYLTLENKKIWDEVDEVTKKYNEDLDNLKNSFESNTVAAQNLNGTLKNNYEQGKLTDEQIQISVNSYDNLTSGIENQRQALENSIPWWQELLGWSDKQVNSYIELAKKGYEYIDMQYYWHEQGKLTEEQERRLESALQSEIETLKKARTHVQENSSEYKECSEKIEDLQSKLNSLTKQNYNTEANINISAKDTTDYSSLGSSIGSKFSSLFTGLTKKISNFIFNLTTPNLPHYDVGTNYVPRDQIAVVHQGEAIVPKKYNPTLNKGSLTSLNNMETNNLLRNLISVIEDKEFSANISYDEIGKASNEYDANLKRVLGR